MAFFFFIGWIPFIASNLDHGYLLFVLVMTPGFYLHNVEVADQDPASGSLSISRYICMNMYDMIAALIMSIWYGNPSLLLLFV